MGTDAIDILFATGRDRAISHLPGMENNKPCLQPPLANGVALVSLIGAALKAHNEFKVQDSVAYRPFEIFWANPRERSHSRLLQYFINPDESHGCGISLLRAFLNHSTVFDLSDPSPPIDKYCKVTCEDEYIDLLITRDPSGPGAAPGKYAIIVENKVCGADDQNGQLQTCYEKIRRRFDDKEIFICYLTLCGGTPKDSSLGNLPRKRVVKMNYRDHVKPWLKGVLGTDGEFLLEGMRANLAHYLDLVSWLLNRENTVQMDKQIFSSLFEACSSGTLPTLQDITSVKESAMALERCYLRLLRARILSTTWQLVQQQLGSRHSSCHFCSNRPGGWWEEDGTQGAPTTPECLTSSEYTFGFLVGGLVIVALGEDGLGVYSGYAKPEGAEKKMVDGFDKFVRETAPQTFVERIPNYAKQQWYSYKYDVSGPVRPEEDAPDLAKKLLQMIVEMEMRLKEYERKTQV
jgi:hypothetical protein